MAEDSREGNIEFTPRPYQLEIFEKARKENVIVCLGTGTGKTFISVMLIKDLAHQIKGTLQGGGKRTFFLVTTVPLVYQQGKAIEDHTNLTVGKYTGDMGVDFWDKADWEKQFNENEVLIMTHQILLNMLSHGYIKASNINLLILDECHHCDKNHPYAKIMERVEESSDQPRVMGLTASIINEKAKKRGQALRDLLDQRMRALEGKLRAVCFTCTDQDSTLPFAAKPIERIKVYRTAQFDPDIDDINREIERLFVPDTSRKPKVNPEKAAYDTYCEAIKGLDEINKSLGLWCTYKAALLMKENTDREYGSWSSLEEKEWLDRTKMIAQIVIDRFEQFAPPIYGPTECILLAEPLIKPKVICLMDILRQNLTDLCAIVFVQRRITAQVLSDLINNMVTSYQDYAGIISDYVYGHNLVELMKNKTGFTMTSKKQEEILKRFRRGEFNVLVATSVVEEGLDVRKCNIVVRFDGISNYREYVQSKGRARAPNSQFFVLAESCEEKDVRIGIEILKEVEKYLIARSREERRVPTEEEIAELRALEEELIPPYMISNEEGAARITKDNAISLLHMYCSKLPSDRFTILKPECIIEKDEYENFTGVITLPINCPLKEIIRGESMPEKKLAKKSAAQKACIRLYEVGELNDHFLPIERSDDSDSDDDDDDDDEDNQGSAQGKEGSKKAKDIYPRKIPDCLALQGNLHTSGMYLYALNMTLTKPRDDTRACGLWAAWYHDERRIFGLLTGKRLPEVPPFPLFTRAGEVEVTIKLVEGKLHLSDRTVQHVSNFHVKILQDFAQDFTVGRIFTIEGAQENALLVPLKKDSHGKHKRMKAESLIDAEFMQQLIKSQEKLASYSPNECEDAVVKKTYLESKGLYYVSKVRHDIKIKDPIANGKPTFKEYYKIKYNKDIKNDQPLLESVRPDTRVNQISPRFSEDVTSTFSSRTDVEHLVPELCMKLPIPASFHCQAVCVPSLLFRLETLLVADELRQRIIVEINGPRREFVGPGSECSMGPLSNEFRKVSLCALKVRLPEYEEIEKNGCIQYQKTFTAALKELAVFLLRITVFLLSLWGNDNDTDVTMDSDDDIYMDCSDVPKQPSVGNTESFAEIVRRPKPSRQNDVTAKPNFQDLMNQNRRQSQLIINDACERLRRGLLGKTSTKDEKIKLTSILQALTTLKANAGFDLERLETLGDSFLKVAVSIYLFYKHPSKDEGRLTSKRKALTSNKKLSREAKKKEIEKMIINTSFGVKQTGKDEDVVYNHARCLWIPPMYKQNQDGGVLMVENIPYHVIRDKSIADSVESLIGAFYEHSGVTGALEVMKWFEIDCFHASLSKEEEGAADAQNTHRNASEYADFPKPASGLIQDAPQNRNQSYVKQIYNGRRFKSIEDQIKYKFKDESYLIQAFTHMSFYQNRATDCYQRLEFLGDAILDFLVISHLCANHSNLDPSSLTNLKSALVNNNTFALLSVKYKFHKCLLQLSPALDSALRRFCDQIEAASEDIANLLENPFIIRINGDIDEGVNAPKALGDIFESLAGAVFLDSGLDLVQVWRVFYPIMQPLIDAYVVNVPLNPVRELHEYCATASASCEKLNNGKIKCTWTVGLQKFEGTGQNKQMAKAVAAQNALRTLKRQ